MIIFFRGISILMESFHLRIKPVAHSTLTITFTVDQPLKYRSEPDQRPEPLELDVSGNLRDGLKQRSEKLDKIIDKVDKKLKISQDIGDQAANYIQAVDKKNDELERDVSNIAVPEDKVPDTTEEEVPPIEKKKSKKDPEDKLTESRTREELTRELKLAQEDLTEVSTIIQGAFVNVPSVQPSKKTIFKTMRKHLPGNKRRGENAKKKRGKKGKSKEQNTNLGGSFVKLPSDRELKTLESEEENDQQDASGDQLVDDPANPLNPSSLETWSDEQ